MNFQGRERSHADEKRLVAEKLLSLPAGKGSQHPHFDTETREEEKFQPLCFGPSYFPAQRGL